MNPNSLIPLEAIQIAKPCRADWNHMTGDERARFCGSCHKNVYDISQMTREQAHQLIAEKEGNLCLRLYRRPDGTVITSDCPVGKREAARPMWWTLAGFVALMASGAAVWSQPADNASTVTVAKTSLIDRARAWPIVGAVVNKVAPTQITVGDMVPILGRIQVVPAPTATPQPTNAPLMGKPTMNDAMMGAPTMGEPMPLCEETPQS